MFRTTRMSRYQKGKTSLDFTEARDSEWQWHQLGHMQVCISLLTDNHANTPPLSFLQAGCPSCRPTNSVKALKMSVNFTLHVEWSTCHQQPQAIDWYWGSRWMLWISACVSWDAVLCLGTVLSECCTKGCNRMTQWLWRCCRCSSIWKGVSDFSVTQ